MELNREQKQIADIILGLKGEFSLNQLVDLMESHGCIDKDLIIDTLGELRDAKRLSYNEVSDEVWAYKVI